MTLQRFHNIPPVQDDVIKRKHFPRYWSFVRGIHRSPVNSPHKGQWRGVLMFSLICAWTNGWVNNRDAGDLRRHRAHYDVFVMCRIAELITVRQKRPWLWPDIIYNNIPAGREHAKCLQILHGYTDDVSTLQFLMLFFIIGVYAMNTGVPKDLARFRRLFREKKNNHDQRVSYHV